MILMEFSPVPLFCYYATNNHFINCEIEVVEHVLAVAKFHVDIYKINALLSINFV
jgi:hypothetical protein